MFHKGLLKAEEKAEIYADDQQKSKQVFLGINFANLKTKKNQRRDFFLSDKDDDINLKTPDQNNNLKISFSSRNVILEEKEEEDEIEQNSTNFPNRNLF